MSRSEKIGANTQSAARPAIILRDGLGALEESIRKAIAYRAYEIYQTRGRTHGSDMGDWFNAERELLKPSNVQIAESGGYLTLRAGVPGFKAGDIQTGISSQRIIVWGQTLGSEGTRSKLQMLGEIDLPVAVDAAKASATVCNDVLDFNAPIEKSRA